MMKDISMKQLLKSHLSKQMEQKAQTHRAEEAEKKHMRKLVDREQERFRRDQERSLEGHVDLQASLKSTVDAQQSELARRNADARIREIQEAAELQVRTSRQLIQETAARNTEKQRRQRELREAKRAAQDRAEEQRRQHKAAKEEYRQGVEEALAQDECRLVAATQRLRAAQAVQDANSEQYIRSVGKAEADKHQFFEKRDLKDMKVHEHRMDEHYSRREAARERQRQMVVQTLNYQLDSKNTKKISTTFGRKPRNKLCSRVSATPWRRIWAELAFAEQKSCSCKKI